MPQDTLESLDSWDETANAGEGRDGTFKFFCEGADADKHKQVFLFVFSFPKRPKSPSKSGPLFSPPELWILGFDLGFRMGN